MDKKLSSSIFEFGTHDGTMSEVELAPLINIPPTATFADKQVPVFWVQNIDTFEEFPGHGQKRKMYSPTKNTGSFHQNLRFGDDFHFHKTIKSVVDDLYGTDVHEEFIQLQNHAFAAIVRANTKSCIRCENTSAVAVRYKADNSIVNACQTCVENIRCRIVIAESSKPDQLGSRLQTVRKNALIYPKTGELAFVFVNKIDGTAYVTKQTGEPGNPVVIALPVEVPKGTNNWNVYLGCQTINCSPKKPYPLSIHLPKVEESSPPMVPLRTSVMIDPELVYLMNSDSLDDVFSSSRRVERRYTEGGDTYAVTFTRTPGDSSDEAKKYLQPPSPKKRKLREVPIINTTAITTTTNMGDSDSADNLVKYTNDFVRAQKRVVELTSELTEAKSTMEKARQTMITQQNIWLKPTPDTTH